MRQIVARSDSRRSESRLQAASAAGEGPAEAGTQNSLRILDVGCGTGANIEMLSQFGQAEGVDVSDDALEFCRKKGLTVQKGLAETLPYPDETFDITTALDVIEHSMTTRRPQGNAPRHQNRRLFAHLRSGFHVLWGVQDDISHHRIRYTRTQITERIENAGFKVERAPYANFTFSHPSLQPNADESDRNQAGI